jgi:signal transduction histidine kinase
VARAVNRGEIWVYRFKLRVSIREMGCGIPADVLPRIFEPFTSLAGHRTRHAKNGTPGVACRRMPSSLISTPMPGFSDSRM